MYKENLSDFEIVSPREAGEAQSFKAEWIDLFWDGWKDGLAELIWLFHF